MSDELTDEELMSACAREDSFAHFELLVRRWEGRLYSFLAKATRQPEEALDLRQEVLLRVWRYRASYRADGAFPGWLFRIATNTLRDHQRKRSNHPQSSLDGMLAAGWEPPKDPGPGPGDTATAQERSRAINQALGTLPDDDRVLLLLRFHDGIGYRELSTILQTPETTLKSRVHRLLQKLRGQLQEFEPAGALKSGTKSLSEVQT